MSTAEIPQKSEYARLGTGDHTDRLGFRLVVALLWRCSGMLRPVRWHVALREQFEANTPMRRPGTVEDIATCALYLASPASSWVTRKIYQVDGGAEAPAMSVPTPPL